MDGSVCAYHACWFARSNSVNSIRFLDADQGCAMAAAMAADGPAPSQIVDISDVTDYNKDVTVNVGTVTGGKGDLFYLDLNHGNTNIHTRIIQHAA